jgi:hypothetical protein
MDITKNLFGNPTEEEEQQKSEEPKRSRHDEYFDFALGQMFSREDIEMKTDLQTKQINHFARGLLYAKTFKSTLMHDFVELQMTLLVSNKRGGRKEMQEMIRSSIAQEEQIGGLNTSISDRMFGNY